MTSERAFPGSEAGVTLVELLISMFMLAVILTAFISPLINSTRQTAVAQRVSVANAEVRGAMDAIRNAWQSRANYDITCVPMTLPANTTITVRVLTPTTDLGSSSTDTLGSTLTLTTVAPSATCSTGTANTAAFRRVTVTITRSGQPDARLVMDIPRPPA